MTVFLRAVSQLCNLDRFQTVVHDDFRLAVLKFLLCSVLLVFALPSCSITLSRSLTPVGPIAFLSIAGTLRLTRAYFLTCRKAPCRIFSPRTILGQMKGVAPPAAPRSPACNRSGVLSTFKKENNKRNVFLNVLLTLHVVCV